MDSVDRSVALAGFSEDERALEILVDRRREPLDLLRREIGRELEGRELREPEDLVGVRAADARQRALVAQERMKLAALAAEDLAKPLCAEPECVGAEVGELGLEPFRGEQPHAGPPFLSSFGEDELAAVGEREPEHRRLRRLRAGRVVAQPPGAHQVHAEDELAVHGREEQVLASAARARERPPVEGRDRRIERLHRGDVRRAGTRDRRLRDEGVELAHPHLNFR